MDLISLLFFFNYFSEICMQSQDQSGFNGFATHDIGNAGLGLLACGILCCEKRRRVRVPRLNPELHVLHVPGGKLAEGHVCQREAGKQVETNEN
jgi:hypothetical protein